MVNSDNSSSHDDILDVGKQLRQEKLRKNNKEKLEEIKMLYHEEQKKEQQKKEEKENSGEDKKVNNYKTVFFLTIIIILAMSIRLYVASMPITDSWAETVVYENLKNQVSQQVYEKYPTLSEEKKQELILQGALEALAAEQNKKTIETISEGYKESYRDPEGNTYLYEIDPYFFYEIAQNEEVTLNAGAHNLLPFIERLFHVFVQFIFPQVSFVKAIFYLPLVFTILCSIILFFIGKEIWNQTTGFIAGIIFVIHPLLLEFSMLGFTDTNMLNMFFILATGLLYLYAIKILKTKEHSMKKYVYLLFLIILIIILITMFRYNWSAWYVSVGLILVPLGVLFFLFVKDFIFSWKAQAARRKKVFMTAIILILIVGVGFFSYNFGKEEWTIQRIIEQKFLTPTLKKYLHVEYENPYGEWPDAFSLIKELQTTEIANFIVYLGGNFIVLLSVPIFLYLFYIGVKTNEGKYLYLSISYALFLILSFRAIRILPYFIPYLALTVGISIEILASWSIEKMQPSLKKEKRKIRFLCMILLYGIIAFSVVFSFKEGIKEKESIMPIMDDAIYDSTVFIKENANESAKVNTWWDRGTFYKALAEREVHLHSQPHMPTTYWLATIYETKSEIKARNILSVINCQAEYNLFTIFNSIYPVSENVKVIHEMFGFASQAERDMFISKSLDGMHYLTEFNEYTDERIYGNLKPIFNCLETNQEIYIVVIDDLMPRFSAVQYFAAWDFAAQQADPTYPYTDLNEGGCQRTQSGAYCSVNSASFYLNFTNLNIKANIAVPEEVYLVTNGTVQHQVQENVTVNNVLFVYERAGYWKALYLPKEVADSMYIRLMILDGYNLTYFEKVFDEVHVETSWVKVYKVKL